MTDANQDKVVIIGAGVAGLAAARQLTLAGLNVTVLEKASYPGGRVHTEVYDGFEIESYAEFFTNFYDLTKQLICELGLQKDVVSIAGGIAISRSGRRHKIWPADLSLLFTDLISFRSKLISLKILGPLFHHWNELDIYAPYKANLFDKRSVAEYVQGELDNELLEYVFEPMLAGISFWTPEHTSQVPFFLALKFAISMQLFTLHHGIGRLPESMAAQLSILYNADATSVIPNEHGSYTVDACINGRKCQFIADGVVCAAPAVVVPTVFPYLTTRQRTFFEKITYSATVDIYLGLDHRLPSSLYGIFYSRREVENLASVIIQSERDPGQIPAGYDGIKLFSSGVAAQKLLDKDDSFIQSQLLADLRHAGFPYDPEGHILFSKINRVSLATPQFDVGHYERLKMFAEGEIESGCAVFAGDYLGGPFIEGAITSGVKAANRLLQRLNGCLVSEERPVPNTLELQ